MDCNLFINVFQVSFQNVKVNNVDHKSVILPIKDKDPAYCDLDFKLVCVFSFDFVK